MMNKIDQFKKDLAKHIKNLPPMISRETNNQFLEVFCTVQMMKALAQKDKEKMEIIESIPLDDFGLIPLSELDGKHYELTRNIILEQWQEEQKKLINI